MHLVLAENAEVLLQVGKAEVSWNFREIPFLISLFCPEMVLLWFTVDAEVVLWTWDGFLLLWSQKRQTQRD